MTYPAKRTYRFILGALLVLSPLATDCSFRDSTSGYIEVTGTVRHIDLEGGFWGIAVDDGRNFDPVDLPERYRKDGMKVWCRLSPRDELAGTHMWGQIVEIREIRTLDPGDERTR